MTKRIRPVVHENVSVGRALAFLDALLKNKAVCAQLEGELGLGKVLSVKAHETGDRDIAGAYLDMLYCIEDRVGKLISDMEPRFSEMTRQTTLEDFSDGGKKATKKKAKKKATKKRGA